MPIEITVDGRTNRRTDGQTAGRTISIPDTIGDSRLTDGRPNDYGGRANPGMQFRFRKCQVSIHVDILFTMYKLMIWIPGEQFTVERLDGGTDILTTQIYNTIGDLRSIY